MGEQSEVFYNLINEMIYQIEKTLKTFLDYQIATNFSNKKLFQFEKNEPKEKNV